jgi:hypothetical protein
MKIKLLLASAFFFVCVLSNGVAAHGQTLYPVKGPLASQPNPPTFSAKSRNPMFSFGSLKTSSGSMTLVLAHGEKLQGKLITPKVTASTPDTGTLGDPASYPPQPNLAFAWDAVFGSGYYVANVMGKNIWQQVFTGDQGTILQVEMYEDMMSNSVVHRFSVAVDNKGNLYKVAW